MTRFYEQAFELVAEPSDDPEGNVLQIFQAAP